jgi:hypothetical protein
MKLPGSGNNSELYGGCGIIEQYFNQLHSKPPVRYSSFISGFFPDKIEAIKP